MENPNYYAVIPANVRYDKSITPNAKLLYGEITALSNKTWSCRASDSYFAELYGVSKTSIQNWLSSLEAKWYISREVEYQAGTKNILRRYTRILAYPIQDNLYTPIQDNLWDNNTSINNTINNIYRSVLRKWKSSLTITVEENQKLLDEWRTQKILDQKYDEVENYSKNWSYVSLYLTTRKRLKDETKPKNKTTADPKSLIF